MFSNDNYATIWEHNGVLINDKDTYAVINVSTSRKDKDGNYKNDFSGYVRFVSKAYDKITSADLKNRDKLKLLEVGVTHEKGQDGKYYTNFVCWDCEIIGDDRPPKQPEVQVMQHKLDEIDESQLPF